MNKESLSDVVKKLRIRKVNVKRYDLSATIRVASKYYKCLNTPVALSCFLLLKYGEYDQLVTKNISPADYDNGIAFSNDYAATKFLAKCAGLPTTFDLQFEALKVEAWAEAKCKQTNLRILKTYPEFHVNRIRCIAQDIISDILGLTPSFEELTAYVRFGPGSTSATTGPATTSVDKVSIDLHTCPEALQDVRHMVQLLPFLCPELAESLDFVGPLIGPRDSDIIPGNTFISVPKSAKTDRAIAIPVHSMSLGQLALGHILRNKLRTSKYGIDLNNLWKTNQEFARLGSIGTTSDNFSYVTVDVTCASSTIAFETIFDLLPRSWALLLARWREPHTLYGDSWHSNHKFSSMGNGYTFELESLLFFALAKAAQIYSGDIRAVCTSFGDDIITTASSYGSLVDVFSFYGLTVNPSKSFTHGYFRESCGADFWQGARINPPYLKEPITNESSIVKLANRIRDYSRRIGYGYYCDIRLKSVWLCLIDLLPNDTAFTHGSEAYGDTVVWCDANDRWLSKPIYHSSQFYTRSVTKSPNRRKGIRFENKLGAWGFIHPAHRESVMSPAISLNLCGPIIGPYGTLYRLLNNSEAVVLPTNCRGESGNFVAKICSSSVMDYFPPWG